MDTFLPQGFTEIFGRATKEMITSARIQALLIAYDKALEDPQAKLPSYLHATIEALRNA